MVNHIIDEEVQLATRLRIGELARNKLGDRDLARTYYKKALELRADDRRALLALESLYEEAGDGPALLEILKRRVDAAESDDEKKQLLFRQSQALCRCLGRSRFGDPGLRDDPRPGARKVAISELSALYQAKERWQDLVVLHERQLAGDDGEQGRPPRSDCGHCAPAHGDTGARSTSSKRRSRATPSTQGASPSSRPCSGTAKMPSTRPRRRDARARLSAPSSFPS